MQRKATKNTRGPNHQERKFQGWLKEQPCCVCNKPGPSIVDHCQGSTFKHNKMLIGHWFCIPLCPQCDAVHTLGSEKAFREKFGLQSEFWRQVENEYTEQTGERAPPEVYAAIIDWGR